VSAASCSSLALDYPGLGGAYLHAERVEAFESRLMELKKALFLECYDTDEKFEVKLMANCLGTWR